MFTSHEPTLCVTGHENGLDHVCEPQLATIAAVAVLRDTLTVRFECAACALHLMLVSTALLLWADTHLTSGIPKATSLKHGLH